MLTARRSVRAGEAGRHQLEPRVRPGGLFALVKHLTIVVAVVGGGGSGILLDCKHRLACDASGHPQQRMNIHLYIYLLDSLIKEHGDRRSMAVLPAVGIESGH